MNDDIKRNETEDAKIEPSKDVSTEQRNARAGGRIVKGANKENTAVPCMTRYY